ncbi:MAG: Flp pilus assembly complex ATPase component TadA, partial [Acidobacteria bacterium]|nr:Flp pilus assembly complex ATPase component TadA [Acidobacteriota bacterium]
MTASDRADMSFQYAEKGATDVKELKAQLAYRQALQEITNEINSADNLDSILIDLKDRILLLFRADRITIYVIDNTSKELFSRFKVGTELSEIRIPISASSIAGYTALTGTVLNISDAYENEEIQTIHPDLKFDKSWDVKSGYRTTQVLAAPIQFESNILGVLQLINRKDGSRFTRDDETSAGEIAKILAIAFQNQRRLARRRPTRFDYLTSQGLVTQDELDKTITQARQTGQDVEQILMKNHRVPKDRIGMALSEFYKCRFIKFDDKLPIPGELLQNLKKTYLRTNFWVPLGKNKDGSISVLMDDVNHLAKRDMAQTLLKTTQIEYCVSLKEDILKYIEYFFGGPTDEGSMADIMAELGTDASAEEESEQYSESDSAIAQLANKIINDGYNQRVSDIHLEPYENTLWVRFRIDGVLQDIADLTPEIHHQLVSRIKILGKLKLNVVTAPQDGSFSLTYNDNPVDIRVSVLPSAFGESLVMRILRQNKGSLNFDELGVSDLAKERLFEQMRKPNGMILTTGPTGSGKTTTLYAILSKLNE